MQDVSLNRPEDLEDLAVYSARIGNDPDLIQAAGGNTSVKADGVMWIKASGTRLSEALDKDIFVPVDVEAMRAEFDDPLIDADKPVQFLLGSATLRPSIETSLHAVFGQRVVIHVHCVNTLSWAIRKDAEEQLKSRLGAFDWCCVPYAKPGANLARAVRDRLGPETDVAILLNHGFLVAADTVVAARSLLERVVAALDVPAAQDFEPDLNSLGDLANADWALPDDPRIHLLAEPSRAGLAAGGSFYPDHVIFCGIAAQVVEGSALPDPARAAPFIILPGRGVLVQPGWSSSAEALAYCLADVLARVPAGTQLVYFSQAENAELLDWDAEKYRQKLDV